MPTAYSQQAFDKVVIGFDDIIQSAWVDGIKVHLEPEETIIEPADLAKVLNEEHYRGVKRCSYCRTLIQPEEFSQFYSFAGRACSRCNDAKMAERQKEITSGHVCRFCHKPYMDCCC